MAMASVASGRGRGKLHRPQVRWPGSHSTNEFGAPCFDRTEHIFDMRPKESATEPRRDKIMSASVPLVHSLPKR